MTRRRTRPWVAAVLVVMAGCGTSSSDVSTSTTAPSLFGSVPATDAAVTPSSTSSNAPFDPAPARRLGTGLAEHFTLDGRALVVRGVGPGPGAVDCDGSVTATLQVTPLDASPAWPALADGELELSGPLIRLPDNGFVVAETCSSETTHLLVGHEESDGTVARLDRLDLSGPTPLFFEPAASGSTNEFVLGTAQLDEDDPTRWLVEISLATGRVAEKFIVPSIDIVAAADGSYVVGSPTSVAVYGRQGTPREVYDARSSALSTDGLRLVLFGETIDLAVIGDAVTTVAQLPPGSLVTDARWSPGDEAIAFVEAGPQGERVRLLTLDGELFDLTDRGQFGRVTWAPDGRHVAFSRFGDEATNFSVDSLLVALG